MAVFKPKTDGGARISLLGAKGSASPSIASARPYFDLRWAEWMGGGKAFSSPAEVPRQQ